MAAWLQARLRAAALIQRLPTECAITNRYARARVEVILMRGWRLRRIGLAVAVFGSTLTGLVSAPGAEAADSAWIDTPVTLDRMGPYGGDQMMTSVPCVLEQTRQVLINMKMQDVTGCLRSYGGHWQIGQYVDGATAMTSNGNFIMLVQGGLLLELFCSGFVWGCGIRKVEIDHFDYDYLPGSSAKGLRVFFRRVGPPLSDASGYIGIDPGSLAADSLGTRVVALAEGHSSFVYWDLVTNPPLVVGKTPSPGLGFGLQTSVATEAGMVAYGSGRWGSSVHVVDTSTCEAPDAQANVLTPGCASRDLAQLTGNPTYNPSSAYFLRFTSWVALEWVSPSTLTNSDTSNRTWFRMMSTRAVADRYVALGDSFTSGEGATTKDVDYEFGTDIHDVNMCHRSPVAYPNLLAPSLVGTSQPGARFGTAACSGATTENVRKGQWNEGPQLSQLDAGNHVARVVTIGIGGNDNGFDEIVQACVTPFTTHWTCFGTPDELSRLGGTIRGSWGSLVATFKEVRRRSPLAEVYAIGYPEVVNPAITECDINVHLNDRERRIAHEVVNYLNTIVESAARSAGVRYIDISGALVGHRLCEPDPWVRGLTAGDDVGLGPAKAIANESFHPSSRGQAAIARRILALEPSMGTRTDRRECSGVTSLNPCPVMSEPQPAVPGFFGSPVAGDIRPAPFDRDDVTLGGLLPGSNANGTAFSTPMALGTAIVDTSGSARFSIPAGIEPGLHTTLIDGTNQMGQPSRGFGSFFMPGPNGDLDVDGIPDGTDLCPRFPAQGPQLDNDGDGTGDECDGVLDDGPLYDRLPPTVTARPDRPPDRSPWYNRPVYIDWEVFDAEPSSGVGLRPAPVLVDRDGADQMVVSAAACDLNGNCAEGSTRISLDTTAPRIEAVIPPTPPSGYFADSVTVGLNCSDDTSGLELCPDPVTLGPNESATLTATDLAGNSTSISVGPLPIDADAPSVMIDEKLVIVAAGDTISGSASDASSGVASIDVTITATTGTTRYSTDDGSIVLECLAEDRRTCTWHLVPPPGLIQPTIEASATDRASHITHTRRTLIAV